MLARGGALSESATTTPDIGLPEPPGVRTTEAIRLKVVSSKSVAGQSSWYCCRAPRHPWTARRDFPHPASRCTCRVLPREGLDDRRKVWRMGGQANSQAKADGPAQTASARQFDCSRTQAERRAATMRLLARLKAIDSRQEARSARLCQRLCPETRTAEPAIVRGWRRNRGDPG